MTEQTAKSMTLKTTNRIAGTISKETSRYSIAGVLATVLDDKRAATCATDGRSASARIVDAPNNLQVGASFILPREGFGNPTKTPKHLEFLVDDAGSIAHELKGEDGAVKNAKPKTPHIEGKFPPLADVYPRKGSKMAAATVNIHRLYDACKAALGSGMDDGSYDEVVTILIPIGEQIKDTGIGRQVPGGNHGVLTMIGFGEDAGAAVLCQCAPIEPKKGGLNASEQLEHGRALFQATGTAAK